MIKTPLEQAIALLGNKSALARAIGITPWALSKWDINKPPKDRCLAIEKATQGKITAEQLRPDVNWNYIRKKERQ